MTETTAQTTGTVQFSKGSYTIPEATNGGTEISFVFNDDVFQFEITGSGSALVTISATDETAVLGIDYRWTQEQDIKTINVNVRDKPPFARVIWVGPADTADAADKSFTINLTDIVTGTLSLGTRTTAKVIIRDNDPL